MKLLQIENGSRTVLLEKADNPFRIEDSLKTVLPEKEWEEARRKRWPAFPAR
jgi:hypothetical protein